MLKIIQNRKSIEREMDRIVARGGISDPAVRRRVAGILQAVARDGDRALQQFSKQFDHHPVKRMCVSKRDIIQALDQLDSKTKALFRRVIKNIRRFHQCQMRTSWTKNFGTCTLGERVTPIARIGAYIPAGRAPLISTVFMTIIPAQVAGVGDVIAVSPPDAEGRVNPYVLAALGLLGIERVYCAGGAQAIAAMAYGTKTIPKVDKIVGPGNQYVTQAKKALYGIVDIDMLAGPSEIMILADDKAPPDFIAADMLAQAEHDPLSASLLLCCSMPLAKAVNRSIQDLLGADQGPKENIISALAQWGRIFVSKDMIEATELVNRFAPEHLAIMTRSPQSSLKHIRHAGAIFLGPYSPVAIGDYVAGPSHVLPTNSAARFFSGLSVDTYLKKSSLIAYPKADLSALKDTEDFARLEGLRFHATSSKLRC